MRPYTYIKNKRIYIRNLYYVPPQCLPKIDYLNYNQNVYNTLFDVYINI